MKIMVLYRPNSEFGRVTEEFIRDYQRRYPDARLEIHDVDSREGIAMASLYDVMRYPTLMALRDDGTLLKSWDDTLPLMDEIAGYAYA